MSNKCQELIKSDIEGGIVCDKASSDTAGDVDGHVDGEFDSGPSEAQRSTKSSEKQLHKKVLAVPWLAQLAHSAWEPVDWAQRAVLPHLDQIVEVLLLYILPAVYVPIFIACVPERDELISTLHLPLLGIVAGVVSNSLPIGPGVVYLPLLVKVIEHDSVHLSVEFTQASWAVGSGVVGALQWVRYERDQQRDWYGHERLVNTANRPFPRLIIWESLSYTVLPCWAGSIVGLLAEPELPDGEVGKTFGVFCAVLSGYLLYRVAELVRKRRKIREAAYSRGLLGIDPNDEKMTAAVRAAVPTTAWDYLPDTMDVVSGVCSNVFSVVSQAVGGTVQHASQMQGRLTGVSFDWVPSSPFGSSGTSGSALGTGAYTGNTNPSASQTENAKGNTAVSTRESDVVSGREAEAAEVSPDGSPESQEFHPLLTVDEDPAVTTLVWYRLVFVSFVGGLVLLPNIGAGPTLITYSCLLMLGYTSAQSMVTSVITGGVCCWCPFFIHAVVRRDIPDHVWPMWAMVLPGMAIGAWAAPKVSQVLGAQSLEALTALFLLLTTFLFL